MEPDHNWPTQPHMPSLNNDDLNTSPRPTAPTGFHPINNLRAYWSRGSGSQAIIITTSIFLVVIVCCGVPVAFAFSPAGQSFVAEANATSTAQSVSATAYALAHPKPTATLKTVYHSPTTPIATTLSATPASTASLVPTNTPVSVPPTLTPVPQHPTPVPPTPRPATATPIPNTCGAPVNPWRYTFCGGSTITNPPSNFCDYFACIASFWTSTNGYVEECQDSDFSHSGGRQGSCSHHGGDLRPLYQP